MMKRLILFGMAGVLSLALFSTPASAGDGHHWRGHLHLHLGPFVILGGEVGMVYPSHPLPSRPSGYVVLSPGFYAIPPIHHLHRHRDRHMDRHHGIRRHAAKPRHRHFGSVRTEDRR